MFFFLSKALLFLLSPFFWFVVCMVYFIFGKRAKWQKRAKWIGISIFLFFSNSVIFSEVCGWWEIEGVKTEDVKHHDVAIILGGMFEYNNDIDRLSIRRQGDRLFQAVTLYKMKKVDKLLISGDSGYLTDRGLHEAKQIKAVLISWGIPKEDIITEEESVNTHENAEYTAKLLKQSYPHFDSFILVTSGIHMRRSLGCFEKEGIHCTPFSTDHYANHKHSYFWDQYIIPDVSNFVTWNKLFKEVVGYVSYDVIGYI